MTVAVSIGLDVGSTYVKALAVTGVGDELSEVRRPTPWTSGRGGTAQMDADDLVAVVGALLGELLDSVPDVEVGGVGVSGMAEAGVLLDAAGRVQNPIIAWFDPRGEEEMLGTPETFRAAFPERTGLPVGPLATIGKLLHLRSNGLTLGGGRWLNVPEYVAYMLGADPAMEISLASRTGLIDQADGEPWTDALEILGSPSIVLPTLRAAGEVWGSVAATTRLGADLPAAVVGAPVTVAGHDHLVASVAGGVLTSGQLYDSLGTAEALVRPLDEPLDPAARGRLAVLGVNAVRHALPGKSVLLGGARSGLLLRRVLQLLGVDDARGRDDLDRRVCELGELPPSGLVVEGAANHDGVLAIHADADGLSPELLFAATLRHTTEAALDLLALMSDVAGLPHSTVVAGGWARMQCVRDARQRVLPRVSFSPRSEDTAFGAAMFGAYAGSTRTEPFDGFAHAFTIRPLDPAGSS